MEMDVEFFDSRKTGDLISRLQADITKIEMAVSSQFALMLSSGLYMLITLALLFYISVYMTLFTLGIMLPSFVFGPSYGRFMRDVNKNISDAKAKASEVTEEAFSNVRTVKAFATEDHETMHYLS
jgi:ATP-binding cassette subfamily B protein